MKNLGILIDRAGFSQKFKTLAEQLNQIPSTINVVVFYAEYAPNPLATNFPLMPLVNAFCFDGVTISTDIYTTLVMDNFLRATKKYFYQWDIEHVYHPIDNERLEKALNNDNIQLIARNEYRAELLEKTWKKPYSIIREFDHEQLQKLL